METKQAIQVLIQVANLAQSRGLLSLEEAVVVKQSIDALSVENEETSVVE